MSEAQYFPEAEPGKPVTEAERNGEENRGRKRKQGGRQGEKAKNQD
jgi:hypothetical protein